MTVTLSRREVLLGALVLAACSKKRAAPAEDSAIASLETSLGGRIGVCAVDTANESTLSHRADERFAMCSTFKWALVAAILEKVDHAELRLDDRASFGEKDLLEYAPVTKQNLAAGFMSVEALCDAAITQSDNTAANLLLDRVGGPDRLTAFCRRLGDVETRLDRNEPMLNTNIAGDPRDTTTPRAMVGLLRSVITGHVLSVSSRDRLVAWMKACKTGLERLRAGVPADWVAADKTGTGDRGAANDVAIFWPPSRAPVLVAAYVSDSSQPLARLNSAHAEIGRIVARKIRAG